VQIVIEKTVSKEVTRNCVLTRARQISRVLTAIYDQELQPYGVKSPQFTLLVLIAEFGPLSRAELGRRNHQDRSTLTRNLQPLIEQGWVFEDQSLGGRRRPLSLTGQGLDLLNTAAPGWSAAQAKAQKLLGEDGRAAIMAVADKLPRA